MQVAEIQRSRLLAATIRAIEELGYPSTSVAQITRRARVSRRTFYELFSGREECLAAVMRDIVALIEAELSAVDLQGLAWRERVRVGLWTILCFCDREPALARVCFVHALRGGPAVLEQRDEILARLANILDEGRRESARSAKLTPMTAEGLVGAACAILHARLQRKEHRPLRDLQGELTALIVLPYLGVAAAHREQARPAPGPRSGATHGSVGGGRIAGDPLNGVAMRLTYRTARVLGGIGEHPGASNREIAQHAGIADQGQVSKLLTRLERLGLLANRGPGHLKGEPNAWQLTTKGELVAQSIRAHLPQGRRAA